MGDHNACLASGRYAVYPLGAFDEAGAVWFGAHSAAAGRGQAGIDAD